MLHLQDIGFTRGKNDYTVVITMPFGRNDVFTITADANTLYIEGRFSAAESYKFGKAYIKEHQEGDYSFTIPLEYAVDHTTGKAEIAHGKLLVWFSYSEKPDAGRTRIRF